jgi:hypothetical protein
MTLEDIIALVIAPFLFTGIVWILPKWWHNERGLHTDTPPPSWSWSLAFWHALCRVWMPLAISILIVIPPAVVTEFVTAGPIFVVCNVLYGIVAALWFAVVPSVMLFNRPRWLLAPHHRALPGWLAERRGVPVPPVPEPEKPPRWHLAPR